MNVLSGFLNPSKRWHRRTTTAVPDKNFPGRLERKKGRAAIGRPFYLPPVNYFVTSLETGLDLLGKVPAGRTVVIESGLKTDADLRRFEAAGVRAFLIGETFMRAADPGASLRELLA